MSGKPFPEMLGYKILLRLNLYLSIEMPNQRRDYLQNCSLEGKKLNNKLEKEMFSPILEMYSKLLVPSIHPIHHHCAILNEPDLTCS